MAPIEPSVRNEPPGCFAEVSQLESDCADQPPAHART